MPNKDALMVRTVFALARGCGAAQLSDEASSWFHATYYPWIDAPSPRAGGRTPQEVWDTEGVHFLRHFEDIGRRAAATSGGEVIDQTSLESGALAVQKELECPWCPDI